MTKFIVGDWKSFTFQMVKPEDTDLVMQHVRDHFMKYEPMNALLGWSEDSAEDHDELVKWALSHGLSFIVFKKGTKEVAAVNLILNGQPTAAGANQVNPKSHQIKTIFQVLLKVDEISGPKFESNFDARNYADIFITSVASECGGQGLATEMYRRTLEYLKAEGFKAVKSGFTSPGTRAIGTKLGFVEIGCLYYNKCFDERGKQLFPGAKDDEFVREMARKL